MRRQLKAGFSLVELSIVLVIIALITSMGIMATMGVLESARLAATQTRLDEIEKALLSFRLANNRLPCPSSDTIPTNSVNFGLEASPAGICETVPSGGDNITFYLDDGGSLSENTDRVSEGTVPVRALGLSNEIAHDGWGRRFSYTVMASFTSLDAFKAIYPLERCGSDVLASSTLTDFRSNDRAAYVLISAGANGHGSILPNARVMYTNSTNLAERYNCRCFNNAVEPTLTASVQRDFTQDINNANNSFDDIVRYKERWQLQAPMDDRLFDKYRDIQLVIGYSDGVARSYQKQCDQYDDVGTVGTASSTISFIGFSNSNRLLLTYSSGSNCQLFTINDSTLTSVTAPSCPAWNADNAMDLTSDGFLAVATPAAPFMSMWKQSGSSFAAQTPFSYSFAASAPASRPNRIAVSKAAEHVVLSRTTATAYTNLYRRMGSTLVGLTPPAGWFSGSSVVEFSRDGKFLAAAVAAGNVNLWTYVNPSTYTDPVTISTGYSSVGAIDFSPDGKYIAIGSGSSGMRYNTPASITAPVRIYRIEVLPDNTTSVSEVSDITEINGIIGSYATTAGIISVQFSPDSMYLIAVEASAANNEARKVVAFKRQDNLRFTRVRGVDLVQGTAAPTAAAIIR